MNSNPWRGNSKFTYIEIYSVSNSILCALIRHINLQQAASLEKVLKEQQQQQQLELERAWDQDRDIKGNGSASPSSDHRVQEHSPPPAADAQKNINPAQPVTQVRTFSFSFCNSKHNLQKSNCSK